MRCDIQWISATSRLFLFASFAQMVEWSVEDSWQNHIVEDIDGGVEGNHLFDIGGVNSWNNLELFHETIPFGNVNDVLEGDNDKLVNKSLDEGSTVEATKFTLVKPSTFSPVVVVMSEAPSVVTAMPFWTYFFTALSVLMLNVL
uniref:Uncharacterized protein n=1 Tax=Plectus sambesii TaxID=2011161 RepID=A0A914UVR0_9BILA